MPTQRAIINKLARDPEYIYRFVGLKERRTACRVGVGVLSGATTVANVPVVGVATIVRRASFCFHWAREYLPSQHRLRKEFR